MSTWYFAIPAVFALLYAIFGGVEFGLMALVGLLEPDAKLATAATRYFSPAWETTNVFLVASLTSILTLYPRALPELAAVMQQLWLVIAALLLIRAALVLAAHYGKPNRLLALMLAIVSLALPAILIQTVATSLASNTPHISLSFSLAIVAMLAALALGSGYLATADPAHQEHADWLVPAALLVTMLLPWSEHQAGLTPSFLDFASIWPLLAAAILALALLITKYRKRSLFAAVIIVTSIGLHLVLLQLPYLLRPDITLSQGLTNPATASIIAIGFAVALVIIAPSVWWLQRLIASNP